MFGLGIVTIFSYLFDLLSRRTKFPSIILLVLIGIGLRIYTDTKGIDLPIIEQVLPVLGAIGLILIVLEGALELSIEKEKLGMIFRALLTAVITMGLTVTALTLLFHFGFHMPVYKGLINAIPLSIVSSAVAIPSTIGFRPEKREFIIYESSFSDIIGIILFNHALANSTFKGRIFLDFGLEVMLVMAVTLVCSFLLIILLERIRHNIKYFLPIAVMIILYAVGKLIHISSLMLVFSFGLFMRNSRILFPQFMRKHIACDQVELNLKQLQLLTGESAFLIRTFFFLIFGYTIVVSQMGNPWLFLWGGVITTIIFVVRFGYLRVTSRDSITPEVFIAPRGLINILLFLSIPVSLRSELINQYVLLIVFMLSLLVLIWGGVSWRKPRSGKELIEEAGEITSNL